MKTYKSIEVEEAKESKISDVDFDNLSFGEYTSDHMFICDYKNGKWETPKVVPYGPMQMNPSSKVFHYGQAVFEGMKAFKDKDDKTWLFRPEQNYERINKSSERLAIPEFPKEYFFDGLEKLLELDEKWIKPGRGNSLYIRPFAMGIEEGVSASPSDVYRFMIICCPAKAYYNKPVKVKFAKDFSRSADGGVGFAKAAGNYGAQFYPTNLAKEEGFDQVVWTDADTHEYLEEAGTMNIFFRVGDELLTAPTNERILDGVTRKSIIDLAKRDGVKVNIRPVKVAEIVEAAEKGELKEMFGAGTAATVVRVEGFQNDDKYYELPDVNDSYGKLYKEKLQDIQYNEAEDPFDWRVEVK